MNFSTWTILVLAVTSLVAADEEEEEPTSTRQDQRQQPPLPRIHQDYIDVHRISTVESGTPNTLSYRMYFVYDNKFVISPMHDIPLVYDAHHQIFNMVVEIPRWTNAKMEITKQDALNPIRQDTKKGWPRYVANRFPYHGYIWNYGALPQTWEDPHRKDQHTGAMGDNDPIDVCELGNTVARRGEVIQVKLLGVIGLVDEGETDWKLLAINVRDELASQLNGLDDIKRIMPGYLEATIDWFRNYKVPAGKPENHFAFGDKPADRNTALELVEETHGYWLQMITGQSQPGNVDTSSTTISNSVRWLNSRQSEDVYFSSPEPRPPARVPAHADDVFFMNKTEEE